MNNTIINLDAPSGWMYGMPLALYNPFYSKLELSDIKNILDFLGYPEIDDNIRFRYWVSPIDETTEIIHLDE